VCQEYLEHYHKERPHPGEGIGNELLIRKRKPKPIEPILLNEIQCSERLGGLLKSYWRKAA
jgi:putative transposase